MTQFASDAFGGTEDAELSTYSASWVKVTGVTGDAEISSGRARPSSTTTAAYRNTATPAGADYSVECDLYFAGASGSPSAGPIGRCSTSANTFYHARLLDGANIQLFKLVAGTATQLGSSVGITQSTGTSKNLKLNMSGTTIEAYYDLSGSASISQTDSAITADGHPGLRWTATTTPSDIQAYHADNFSADEVGATGYTLTCDAGAFTIAGQDATLLKSKVVSADAGAYVIAGQDATLVYTPASGAYTLTCDAGAYSLAGQDAAFVYAPLNHYTLTAEAGAYQINGQSATFAFSGQPSFTGGGWAEWAKAEKRRRQNPAEEAMQEALAPVVSAPRKTITMASLIGKKAAAELAPFDSSAAVAISRRRKRQRDDELLLLM